MIQTITNAPDGIMAEYMRLSKMNVIEDVPEHIEQWRALAIKAATADRPNTADDCMSRVKYWGGMPDPEYIRLMDGVSFSELIPTHQTNETAGVYGWQDRKDIGDD